MANPVVVTVTSQIVGTGLVVPYNHQQGRREVGGSIGCIEIVDGGWNSFLGVPNLACAFTYVGQGSEGAGNRLTKPSQTGNPRNMTTRDALRRLATAFLVGGIIPGFFAGCTNDKVATGQQNPDAAAGGKGGSSLISGGAIGSGGNARAGGTTGAGGANARGGILGNGGSGGVGANGGVLGRGGAGSGGDAGSDAGCAPGWTMCCGQCLSPQAGICTPCLGVGGAISTGGTRGAGGLGSTGGISPSSGGSGAGGAGGTSGTGKTCGGLGGGACAAGEFCQLAQDMCAVFDMTGTCTVKPQGCTGNYQPVCGCDGTTYENDCTRLSAGVSKKSDGACPTADAGTNDAASRYCSQVTTQTECDARSDCHSVFVDSGTCGCASAGCCAHFNRCVVGGKAYCSGQASCTTATPFCEAPYVVSYTNNCFEGCVRQTECAGGVDAAVQAATCPQTPPGNNTACGSTSLACFYDNCPSTGRTQAICSGVNWAVQTGSCGTVSCVGYGYPGVMTCPSGQVCLITESGAIMARCVSNGCGQGPVTDQCISGAIGCSMGFSLTSGVTMTCNACPPGTTCA
jgi:hypothetical protein